MSDSPESSVRGSANEQFFEIPSDGEPRNFLWARTCADPECDCRSVLIVAHDDPDYLKQQVKDRAASWVRGCGGAEAFGSLTAFEVDLDWFEAFEPLEVGLPRVSSNAKTRQLLARMSEAFRDEVAALWYRGKGIRLEAPDPGSLELLDDWKPGVKVQWSEVFHKLRADSYDYQGLRHIAYDYYCVNPDCGCGEVTIAFESFHVTGGTRVGDVIVDTNGRIKVTANADDPAGSLATLPGSPR